MSARLAPLLGALVLVAGCASGGPPPENGSPGFPSPGPIEVQQASATEPPVFVWDQLDAVVVEVRLVQPDRVVWRIEGAVHPRGRRIIRPPLAYGAPALPPGVHPPDGPDYRATVAPEPLAPGGNYTVRVIGEDGREATAAFTASDTIPME